MEESFKPFSFEPLTIYRYPDEKAEETMNRYKFSLMVVNVQKKTFLEREVTAPTVNIAWESVVKTLPDKHGIVTSVTLEEIKE